MNQVFGYQISAEKRTEKKPIFEGTREIFAENRHQRQIKVFSTPKSSLMSYYSKRHKAFCYIWGPVSHPTIRQSELSEWCLDVYISSRYEHFRELIGTFVIILDLPETNHLVFITDILGIRPMFYGVHQGRLVFGSDVWTMYNSGVSNGKINYDAVSSWIAYKFNCTDGSLFEDIQRLSPGSVTVFHGNTYVQTPYIKFVSEARTRSPEEVSEEIHHIVSSSLRILFRDHKKLCITLSGGYDSRYLLAMSTSIKDSGLLIDVVTVGYTKEEEIVAEKVAGILRVNLKKYQVEGSVWDIYDEVYHFMPDGFPISKFVPYRIAQDHRDIPILNGFMGDALIRGDSDRYQGKYEFEWKESLVDVLQRKHTRIPFRFLNKEIAKRIKERTRAPMEKAVREGSKLGKVFTWQDYYYTHRFYISNNFLQHLDLSEALLPFYNWNLLDYKVKHDYRLFTLDTYKLIYKKYFPELSHIPRSANTESTTSKKYFGISQQAKKISRKLFYRMIFGNCLSLVEKPYGLISLAGCAGLRRVEQLILNFERLYILESIMREKNINFDWNSI